MSPVALLTGASRGLGQTLSGFLAGQGWSLVLTARGEEALHAHVARLRPLDDRVRAVAGDVNDPRHRASALQAASGLGGLDLLVNNASDLGPSPLVPLIELPPPVFEGLFRTNVLAPLAWTREALPLLRKGPGWVINISSDAALGGYPGWGGYGATKAALDLVSRTLAEELRPDGIPVLSVDPGDMRTAMHQAAFPGEDISDRPLPEVTLPFFAWLLNQPGPKVSGQRFRAQATTWEVPP